MPARKEENVALKMLDLLASVEIERHKYVTNPDKCLPGFTGEDKPISEQRQSIHRELMRLGGIV
jgi:hypothetical protein